MSESKGQFNSNFGFIMASVGSAVGLGNLWGFPYKLGTSGGGAFLVLYIIVVVFVGFAVTLGEFTIGRKTGKGAIEAYKSIGNSYAIVGVFAIIAAVSLLSFYCTLGAYCMKYFCSNFVAIFNHSGIFKADATEYFNTFIGNGGTVLIFTAVFAVLNLIIIMGGVSGGIEKFTTIAMPALFIMLIIVIIKSITLEGSSAGLEFMFKPKMEVFQGSGWISILATAGGQVFFSLSLGMAAMITYGSYLSKKESLVKNSIIVPVADSIVAIMAGLAVMPAVFAMGLEPAGGPGLLFITLQTVFNDMGSIGPIFGFLLYFLVFIAAITSSISVLEGVSAAWIDAKIAKGQEFSRKKITSIVTLVVFLLNIPTSLDALGGGSLPQPLGFCWLDFYDLLAEGILMPLGSLIMVIIIGYKLGMDWMAEEIELEGNKMGAKGYWNFCYKVTAPIGMAFILVGQIDSFFGLGIFG